MKRAFTLLFMIPLLLVACSELPVAPESEEDFVSEPTLTASKNTHVSHTTVEPFQAAGDPMGVGLLEEGSQWPPTKGSRATLVRGADYVQVNIHTTGLPPGAYTTWWAIINETDECVPSEDPAFPDVVGDCGFDELFDVGGPSVPSVFWATGGIVQSNGVGNFQDRTYVGEEFGDPFPVQHLWGPGLTNPKGAMVVSIIKYHGPPSDDPDELYEQTHTLLGSCNAAANARPNGQCFDPQWAIFAP